MKKYIYLFLSALITISGYSIPKSQCDIKPACCTEPPMGPFAFSYIQKDETSCPKNITFYADFLYMNSFQDITYVYTIDNRAIDDSSQKFKPGFRFGCDGIFYKDFYFDANWTYVKLKRTSDVSVVGNHLLATFLPNSDDNPMPQSSAKLDGDLNTLDLRLMNPYHVSRYFISNPMIGIRAAWIDQDYFIRYFISSTKSTVEHQNNYFGVGLSASYDALFKICKCVDFYANTIFSLLFGKYDISQQAQPLVDALRYNIEEDYYGITPNGQIALGFIFSKLYQKDKYKISAKLGYEFHYWWHQNQLKMFVESPSGIGTISDGFLSLNGFVFGLSVGF